MDSFTVAAQVLLRRRFNELFRVDEDVEIDMNYITCAEYQLFINAQQAERKQVQPEHWVNNQFASGKSRDLVTGVSASDAEAFCNWLTQQQFTPGYRYRLPRNTEINDHNITEEEIGYWCRDGESYGITGIEQNLWHQWQEQLKKELKLDSLFYVEIGNNVLRPAYNRAHTRISDLANDRDLNLAIDLVISTALAYTLARNLDSSRNLNSLVVDSACAYAGNLALALSLLLTSISSCNLAPALDRVIILVSELERCFAMTSELELASKLANSIERAYASANTVQRSSAISIKYAGEFEFAIQRAGEFESALRRALTRGGAPERKFALTSEFEPEGINVIEKTLKLELELAGVPTLQYAIELELIRAHIFKSIIAADNNLAPKDVLKSVRVPLFQYAIELERERLRANRVWENKVTIISKPDNNFVPKDALKRALKSLRVPLLQFVLERERLGHLILAGLTRLKQASERLLKVLREHLRLKYAGERAQQEPLLKHAHALERQLKLLRKHAIEGTLATLQKRQLELDRDLKKEQELELILKPKQEQKRDIPNNFEHVKAFQMALTLERNRAEINNHDQNPNFGIYQNYLLGVFGLLDWLITLNHQDSDESDISSPVNDTKDDRYTFLKNEAGQLYCYLALIELRRKEKMPAWEGIRIVRERIKL